MNNEKFKNENMEIFKITMFMSIFALVGISMFPVILVLFPVAFIYLGVKRGYLQSIVSMAIVCLFLSMSIDLLSGILMFFMFMPVSYTITDGIKLKKRPWESLAISTLALFLSTLVLYGFVQNIAGVNIVSQIENSLQLVIDTQTEMYREMGLSNFELLKTISLLESTYKNMLIALPTIMIMISFITSYLSYYVSVVLLRKSGYGIIYIPRFSRFKLPQNIILGIIVMYLVVLLVNIFNLPYYEVILTNVTFLVYIMIMTQGLSVADFFLIKLNMKTFIRLIIILVFAFMAPIGMIVFIIGFADIFFDIRKLRGPKS